MRSKWLCLKTLCCNYRWTWICCCQCLLLLILIMCRSTKFSATRMTPSFTSVGSNHCTFEDIKEVSKLYLDTPFESKTRWHLTRFCIFLGEQVIGVAVGPAELQCSDDSLCQNICGVVAKKYYSTSTDCWHGLLQEKDVPCGKWTCFCWLWPGLPLWTLERETETSLWCPAMRLDMHGIFT